MEKKKNLSFDTIVIGLALFAMFFGAGSLIFPPYLGMESGSQWWLGFACFYIADIGLAFVTIVAMINGDGSMSGVTGVIGKTPALLLNTSIIVCIGPLLAIPRTAATTYEMTVLPIIGGDGSTMLSIITSVVYFGLILFLSFRASKIVDIVGKFLTPAMVIILIILIVYGIAAPLGTPGEPYCDVIVKEGLINGYQAMDVLGALGFALIIIATVSEKGYKEPRIRIKVTSGACIIAGGLLFFVYGGICYLGATVSDVYDITTVNQASLIVRITDDLLGQTGVVLLGIMVGLACLTTAIGLTAAAAAYFDGITNGKLKYETVVIIISLFSMVVCNFGLSTIISIAVPILSLVYPVAVTLIILSFFKKKIKNNNLYKGAALMALLISFCSVLHSYGFEIGFIKLLPLVSYGFEWVLPAVVGGLIGNFIKPRKTGEAA